MAALSVVRIMNDVREFYKENPKGIYIVPEEEKISLVHALIIGTEGTPYENGFFYFVLKFPDDYPLNPPKVELRTTSRRTVRFNPNLYAEGKVCLSILGTYPGPAWSAAQTIFSTLLSIQSLMNERPYHNEPGFEEVGSSSKDAEKNVNNYNYMLIHETLRVAVIEMLQEKSADAYGMPTALKRIMHSHFLANYQFYENLIESNQRFDGKPITDPYNSYRPKTFAYKPMMKKIVELKEKLSQNGNNSTLSYNEITEKTLLSGYRDEEKPQAASTEGVLDQSDDMEESVDMDGSNLYESETDDDN